MADDSRADNLRLDETRELGWYAVQRVHLSDWFKANARRFSRTAKADLKSLQKDQEDSSEKKLEDVVEQSHDILAQARTVFPFTLFPDTITIDKHKLTVVHRNFFSVESVVSVPIENIKNIEEDHGPVFGSLLITSDNFVNNTQRLNYLRRTDAQRIQKLVQGAMVAEKEKIDVSDVPLKQLRDLLIDLGEGRGESAT